MQMMQIGTDMETRPNVPLEDFYLHLRFPTLKMFKFELVEFSVWKRFEFTFIKNDAVRVRAKCTAKSCK